MSAHDRQPKYDHLLTEEVGERIVSYLRSVRHFSRACTLAGVPAGAGYRWLRVGRADDATERFRRFATAIDAVMMEFEVNAHKCIDAVANNPSNPMSMKAATWYLERTLPKYWGEREKIGLPQKAVDAQQPQMDSTQILTAVLAVLVKFPEARLEVAQALKQLKAVDAPDE